MPSLTSFWIFRSKREDDWRAHAQAAVHRTLRWQPRGPQPRRGRAGRLYLGQHGRGLTFSEASEGPPRAHLSEGSELSSEASAESVHLQPRWRMRLPSRTTSLSCSSRAQKKNGWTIPIFGAAVRWPSTRRTSWQPCCYRSSSSRRAQPTGGTGKLGKPE